MRKAVSRPPHQIERSILDINRTSVCPTTFYIMVTAYRTLYAAPTILTLYAWLVSDWNYYHDFCRNNWSNKKMKKIIMITPLITLITINRNPS